MDSVPGYDYFFGGTQINNRIEVFARATGQEIDLAVVRSRLMSAHVRATDLDTEGIIGLLSPGQIAEYHHVVFQQFGLPPTTFGGTAFTGSVREAGVYRWLWCQGCDQ